MELRYQHESSISSSCPAAQARSVLNTNHSRRRVQTRQEEKKKSQDKETEKQNRQKDPKGLPPNPVFSLVCTARLPYHRYHPICPHHVSHTTDQPSDHPNRLDPADAKSERDKTPTETSDRQAASLHRRPTHAPPHHFRPFSSPSPSPCMMVLATSPPVMETSIELGRSRHQH